MTTLNRRNVAVVLTVIGSLVAGFVAFAVWDLTLAARGDGSTISWSVALAERYDPMLTHGFVGLVAFILGGLFIHLTRFSMPDPAVYAELDRLKSDRDHWYTEATRYDPPGADVPIFLSVEEVRVRRAEDARRLGELEAANQLLRVRVAELTALAGGPASPA